MNEKLPQNVIDMLSKLPESCMGYQIVDVTLKNGAVYEKQKIINGDTIVFEPPTYFIVDNIENVKLSTKK